MKEAIEYGRVQLSETCITTPVTLFFFPLVVCIQAHSLTHSLTRSITQSLTYSPRGEKRKKLDCMYDWHDTAEGKGAKGGENVVVRCPS